MMHHSTQRGFTLLIAIILTTVLTTVGFALLDIALKQITLSSAARESQVAFYAADAAMECALYWDQQFNAFRFTSPDAGPFTCGGVTAPFTSTVSGNIRTTTLTLPCEGGGTAATVIVQKTNGSTTCSGTARSCIYANGYNTCNAADANRVERGLKVFY